MTTARGERSFFARSRDSFLLARDRRSRLERDAKDDVFAIADAALHATGVICRRPNFSFAHFEWIVVFRSFHSRCSKSRTDLETFCRRQAQHRFSQVRFEFVENRLAQTRRNSA